MDYLRHQHPIDGDSNLAGSWFTSAEPFPDFCASRGTSQSFTL